VLSATVLCQPRGQCASVDDRGASSECKPLIYCSYNSHSLFSYSVDLVLELTMGICVYATGVMDLSGVFCVADSGVLQDTFLWNSMGMHTCSVWFSNSPCPDSRRGEAHSSPGNAVGLSLWLRFVSGLDWIREGMQQGWIV